MVYVPSRGQQRHHFSKRNKNTIFSRLINNKKMPSLASLECYRYDCSVNEETAEAKKRELAELHSGEGSVFEI
ncbi:MAG: hypothetical protein WAZ77_03965 [Candidatus Nitrosopolaris sp.]